MGLSMEKVNFLDIINGNQYGDIVSQVYNTMYTHIEGYADSIISSTIYDMPQYGSQEITKLVDILWGNEGLNLPRIFANPRLKKLLIADTFSRFVDTAYSGMVYYDMFTPVSQGIFKEFLEDLGDYVDLFNNTVSETADLLAPKSFRSEYEYIIGYVFMLLLAPLFGHVDYKPLSRLAGVRSEHKNLGDLPDIKNFFNELNEKFSIANDDPLFFILGRGITLGVINNLNLDINSLKDRIRAKHDGDDGIAAIIKQYPKKILIRLSAILSPMLFSEYKYATLHILCRLLWEPISIYPDRTLRLWLPYGYVDKLANDNQDVKQQCDLLSLPRLAPERRYLQMQEVLRRTNSLTVIDLTPEVTKLLKYQLYCAILHPLLEQLAYNIVILKRIKSSSSFRVDIGKQIYELFRAECLQDTTLRDYLFNGNLEKVRFENNSNTLTKLLKIRETIIQTFFRV